MKRWYCPPARTFMQTVYLIFRPLNDFKLKSLNYKILYRTEFCNFDIYRAYVHLWSFEIKKKSKFQNLKNTKRKFGTLNFSKQNFIN